MIQSENSSDKDNIYTVNKYVVNQRLQRVYDISFRKVSCSRLDIAKILMNWR
jgi:hypothetical protein